MFKRLLSRFQKTFYIQIWENRIKVMDLTTGNVFDEKPYLAIETKLNGVKVVIAVGNSAEFASSSTIQVVNPFSHPRCLFSDFYVAEKLVQHIIKILHEKSLISASPKFIIHPMEKIEGGLTMIESRAFRELGQGSGAMEVVLYTGTTLQTSNLDYEKIKSQDEDFLGGSPKGNSNVGLVVFLVVIVIAIVALGN